MDTGEYDISWSSPSRDWHGSMPLGNGDIALNAWVEPGGDLRFFIAKTDAWDDYARLVKVASVRLHLTPGFVELGGPFRQTLRTEDATLTVVLGPPGRSITTTLWVDANNPVIHLDVHGETPVVATATFEVWRTERHELEELTTGDVLVDRSKPDGKHGPTVLEPDVVVSLGDCVGVAHHNIKSVGPALLARTQGIDDFPIQDPLLHRTFGALLGAIGGLSPVARKEHHFRIAVLTLHPSTLEAWKEKTRSLLQASLAADDTPTRAAHVAWWAAFWDRSRIRATGGDDALVVSRAYHLQRFVTAAAGRGAYPIKFNGSLFTVPRAGDTDPDFRMWGPGYWWQNTRLPYLGMPAAGDLDLMEPLVRMYTGQVLDVSRHRTRRTFGHGGVFYPECLYFWGAVMAAAYGSTPFEKRTDKLQDNRYHKWEWVGGLELCWMLLDLWEHRRRPELLREAVLPVAREVLAFFDEHYPSGPDGRMHMHPSQAVETWWECTDPLPEIAGLRAVIARLLALEPETVDAADRARWIKLAAKVPDLPLRDVGGKPALAPARLYEDKRNSENPELYAVFPFRLIAVGKPNLEWGLRALEARWDRGHFGWRQDDLFMAYLGLGEQARAAVVDRASHHDPAERFPVFWGPNYDWTPDQDHGGVLTRAFQAMAMQTDGASIRLLPAWPAAWDVDFKLHAPYETTVECVLRGGTLVSLVVTPRERERDVILPDWVKRP